MREQPGGYGLEDLRKMVGQKVALFGGGWAANVFEVVRLLDVWVDRLDGEECIRVKVETNDWRNPFTPYLISYGIGELTVDLPLGRYVVTAQGVRPLFRTSA